MTVLAGSSRCREAFPLVNELDPGQPSGLEQTLVVLLGVTTVDVHPARKTCRLCAAHACDHYEGACPVTQVADR